MKEIPKRFLLTAVCVCACLVLGETVFRLLDIPRFHQPPVKDLQFNLVELESGELLVTNVPSSAIHFKYDGNPRGYFGTENGLDHTTNALGFRGGEFSLSKPPATVRIAFLGDSFTFGEGVKDSDTYSEVASRLLNESFRGDGRGFEGYNFGVGGYNIRDSLSLLKLILTDFKPDIVVQKLDIGDAEPRLFEWDHEENRDRRIPRWYEADKEAFRRQPPDSWLYASRLAQAVWKVRSDRRQTRLTTAYYRSLFDPAGGTWPDARSDLREMAELCRERGIPLYVLFFPILTNMDDSYPFADLHRLIQRDLASDIDRWIDLLPLLRDIPIRDVWVHPADHHPNEKIHRIVAEAVARTIEEDTRSNKPSP